MKYLKEFATQQEYEAYINNNPDLPNVSLIDEDESVKYNVKPDYSKEYLTFVALEDGTFKFNKVGTGNDIQYSLDGGDTWVELSANENTPTIHQGEKIMWKAELTPSSVSGSGKFSSTGRYDVEGNPMSLLYGDNFVGQTSLTGKDSAFLALFKYSNKLINAKKMSLPATTLSNKCYNEMFYECSLLITPPELPATTLTEMCYSSMFYNCINLTTAPDLPATTLAKSCYIGMFAGCTSLTTAPELPAVTLEDYCYWAMFLGCSGLTTAPELPATKLKMQCYQQVFENCTNINYIKMLATSIGLQSLLNWVNGVSATGTFVKAASQTSLPTGASGIPDGWTVQNV